ncbi:filamentous hemagglutinin N-terminal domain-containing protein [Campylobacter ornithocola]|nr:filamentous hemagglutinin N-terminal domain-containing protein [Campylobacter ornithocola]QKF57304.1 hemagglutinin domain-containing protein [Campylobacter ornithocola]
MKAHHKLSNHIILSGITVSMLFSPLMALPSGGKFTHGTSGTISGPYFDKNTGKNTIDITGKTPNKNSHVIQWGGGFSINKGESVNFKGQGQNYLNIAHGTSKSTIDGLLNASGNNVFLINPNGVIITKNGIINANRFVASTSSLEATHFEKFKEQGASFSPVFKPSKGGNVVNMGNINANNVLLIGNKVDIQGGSTNGMHNANTSGDALKRPSGNTANKVHLVGNEVYILADGINSDSIIASAYSKGALQQSTTSYYNYGNSLGKLNFITQEYDNIDKANLGDKKLVTKDKFEKHATIASDIDWWHFAKGWNENKNEMRDFFDTYKLTNDVDFGGNQGKNYANYCIDGLGCTNMIVGYNDAFTKTFDGQRYTLKNINIDTTNLDNKPKYVGIFGKVEGVAFKNINVDYMDGGILVKNSDYVGGFVGFVNNGNFENIFLKNIKNINNNGNYAHSFNATGGFAGAIDNGIFSNISLNNIRNINSNHSVDNGNIDNSTGGFAGVITGKGSYSNISLNNIGNISGITKSTYKYAVSGSQVGGFVGEAEVLEEQFLYSNISLNNIGNISGSSYSRESYTSIGGFVGQTSSIMEVIYSNISLDGIKNIIGNSNIYDSGYGFNHTGGFIGFFSGYYIFSNISLNNIGNISGSGSNSYNRESYSDVGGFAGYISKGQSHFKNVYVNIKFNNGNDNYGKFFGGANRFSDVEYTFNNIHIYHHENDLTNATADQAYWNDFNKNGYVSDKINIHTYNDNTQESVYKDFLSKANTIEKPNITPPSNPTDPTNPSNPDVVLGSDDVISKEDLNQWLDEIFAGNYWVDIKDLDKIHGLNESIIQSISFLEALYGQEGMKDILEKFHNDYKTAYSKYEEFKNNKAELLAFINEKLKPLVEHSNNSLKQLLTKQKELDSVVKAYNAYVELINKGLASKNDQEFKTLENKLNSLMSESQILANSISNNQMLLEKWQGKTNTDSNGHFTIKGAFANAILNTNPDLKEITGDGGSIDDPNRPELPATDLTFEQTASLNLIGNNSLEEEEEQEEIEEASMNQKGKTCIVSDNYKTMNPCVVGGL